MKFEEMTVKELRQESRNRGLTLESKGHKFTKAELVERLNEYDSKIAKEQSSESDVNNKTWIELNQKEQENVIELEIDENVKIEKNDDLETLTVDDIESRYGGKKEDYIYDNMLKVDCMVVYVRYVETRSGLLLKKLGTAKVVGVNRKKELVRVETPVGEEKELTFADLLFIRRIGFRKYPRDIDSVLYAQRQEVINYRKQVEERYAKNGKAGAR